MCPPFYILSALRECDARTIHRRVSQHNVGRRPATLTFKFELAATCFGYWLVTVGLLTKWLVLFKSDFFGYSNPRFTGHFRSRQQFVVARPFSTSELWILYVVPWYFKFQDHGFQSQSSGSWRPWSLFDVLWWCLSNVSKNGLGLFNFVVVNVMYTCLCIYVYVCIYMCMRVCGCMLASTMHIVFFDRIHYRV